MSQAFRMWWQEVKAWERHDAVHDPETPERIEACQARKDEMLRRARAAGLTLEEHTCPLP